jgi:hypothetical protein
MRVLYRAVATALSNIQPKRVLRGFEVVATFVVTTAAVLFVSFAAVVLALS